jgi:hypothetical protein
MTIEGIDYAFGRPNFSELKKAGKKFVCRYVSDGNNKDITKDEAQELRHAGLEIVIVYESTANRALAGFNAGAHDADVARKQANSVGCPPTLPIYFAVDFDANEQQQAAINAYLRGAVSVLGRTRVGVYGGYWVVKRALDAKVCKFGWQTYAWSGDGHGGTLWDTRAHIQQYENNVKGFGIQYDKDRAIKTNYGQWKSMVAKPKPKPKIKPPWILIDEKGRTAGTGRLTNPLFINKVRKELYRKGRATIKARGW